MAAAGCTQASVSASIILEESVMASAKVLASIMAASGVAVDASVVVAGGTPTKADALLTSRRQTRRLVVNVVIMVVSVE